MLKGQNNPGKGDVVSAGTAQAGSARIEYGRVYSGVITEAYHGDNLYDVTIDGIQTSIKCMWAAGIFAPMLGFSMKYLPPVNTKVVVLASSLGAGWIISTIPGEAYDEQAGAANSMLAMGLHEKELEPYKQVFGGAGLRTTHPNDLLEGEFAIMNNFGVAVQWLTTMVKMQASERAKIEAFIMDDMVRIVSDTYKHFTSFGDFQVYKDGGKLNVRWDGTSYEHESYGMPDDKAPKVELDDKKVDFQKTFNETGRWRFSEFIGFLGDFIHTFVSEPHDTLGGIAEEAIRPGKARLHVHNDGSVLVQSVADIALERVCRVVVPVEKKRHDDPEGQKTDEFAALDKSYLEIWKYGKDMKKAHYSAYQLRQYARWLSCYHGYARFHQLNKDWHIPKETDDDMDHSWFNKEEDVEQANAGEEETYDAYATFRIMRDGSIVVMDAFNSAITMVRGNIQISAVRHIELDAAGDIRMSAGQNIYIKARRNIEISAIVGGLILKSRAWWKALCEWGSVWIKSDAVDPTKDSPPEPEDSTQDPEPEVMAAAVFIDAPKGQTIVQSDRRITIATLGEPDDAEGMTDTTASVVLQSKQQDVRVIGARHAILKSKGQHEGSIIVDAQQAKAFIVRSLKTLIKAFVFDINSKLTFKSSILNLNEIRTKRAHIAQTVTGPECLGVDHVNDKIPHHGHGHHMHKYNEDSTPVKLAEEDDVKEREDYVPGEVNEVKPHEDNGDPTDGPDWAFNEEEKTFDGQGYAGEPSEDEVFQPMAQQRLYESGDDAFIRKDDYEEWNWQTDNKLKEGKRTKTSSAPFPGVNGEEKVVEQGSPLHRPLDELYSEQAPSAAEDPVPQPTKRKYIKLA